MLGLDRPRGDESRELRLGRHVIRVDGLDRELAGQLDRHWPGFFGRAGTADPLYTLHLLQGDGAEWLGPPHPSEPYRVEAFNAPSHRVLASYHFALCAGPAPGTWRAAVEDHPDEPPLRIVENALRCLAGRLALELGGLGLHAAGVVRAGRAYLFAGPSRSGKTTAVGLSAPSRSLGDDFAMVLPEGDGNGWVAPVLPFDNASPVEHEPVETPFPVAGIWRLYPSTDTRVEKPPFGAAVASLLGCAAMPWIYPEFAADLLERASRLVTAGLFAHLRFTKDPGFWTRLVGQ
jgi:hypothetical protein